MDGIADSAMPRRVIYGRDAAAAIAAEVAGNTAHRIFVLTTPSLSAQPYLEGIRETLGSGCVGVFTRMTAHTPDTEVLACAAAARQAGAQILLAVGGGSVIDGAKLVRLCLDEGISDRHGLAAWRSSPVDSAVHQTKLIAVPTTLSAAEFSGIAGLSDTEAGVKNAFHHPCLVPDVVVLDPSAIATAPDWLILSSGIRAVDHCLETILSVAPNPYADASAIHGLRLLTEGLPKFRDDPSDRANRLDLQFGMWLSMTGPCMGVPLGASHAIGRALGGVFGIPHGRTSCVMLAPVLEWNAVVDGERQRKLTEMLAWTSRSLSERVRALVDRIGEPSRLRDVGLRHEDVERAVQPSLASLKVRSVSGNIRPITGADDVRRILEAAW